MTNEPRDPDVRADLEDQAEGKADEVLDREAFEERLMQADESEEGKHTPHVETLGGSGEEDRWRS
ncbi:MAG TPA: hypothetical protein VKO35_08650 [Acidimicrobiia bacterium]|nr:hypothetical protein [Acidimicrobiia bacterium]